MNAGIVIITLAFMLVVVSFTCAIFWEQRNNAELEVMRLTEEIDLAAVVSKALHPANSLRPLGVVVSLDDRRGGA